MRVIPVPCLSDNYAYLVVQGGLAAVVDPSEADPVLRALDEHALELSEIWLTHHHQDSLVAGLQQTGAVDHGQGCERTGIEDGRGVGLLHGLVRGAPV